MWENAYLSALCTKHFKMLCLLWFVEHQISH